MILQARENVPMILQAKKVRIVKGRLLLNIETGKEEVWRQVPMILQAKKVCIVKGRL